MGRKSNGEGSIYFVEKEQKWRAEINWIDSSGKIRRKCWKDKKQSEVKAKLLEFKKQLLLDNVPEKPENRKFREFADEWMITTQKPRLKPLSYDRKATTLTHQVYPYIGGIQISRLTHTQIQKMVNELNARGLSYSTIKKAYEAVSSCLRYYRIKTSTSHNPCEGIALPEAKKKQSSDIKFFNAQERKKIATEATREYSSGTRVYRLGWVFVLMMYTGMRIGELCALTWKDIDFKNKTITINKNAITLYERDAKGKSSSKIITQHSTKTSSGTRIIPMTEKAFDALIELYKITGRFEHITTTTNGKRIMPTRLSRTFYKILDAAGIRRAGCHTLRHTFATMLFSNGCEVKIVSELLGHSNTKITENIYIHLIQQQKVKAIASIDKYSD
jgi:integrase